MEEDGFEKTFENLSKMVKEPLFIGELLKKIQHENQRAQVFLAMQEDGICCEMKDLFKNQAILKLTNDLLKMFEQHFKE